MVELQTLLKGSTKAVREQITRKIAKEIADAKKAKETLTKGALNEMAVATKAALAKQAANLTAEAEKQRKHDEQEAERKQKRAIQIAVDATRADALKLSDKLPKKATTAQEAIALDEAIVILRGIVFTIDKSALKEKRNFKQAVAFLKARHAFQALVVD